MGFCVIIKKMFSIFSKIAIGFASLLLAGLGALSLSGQGNSLFEVPPGQVNQIDDFLRSDSDIRLIKKNLVVEGDIIGRGNLKVANKITTEDQRIIIDSASRQVLIDADVVIGGSPEQLTVRGDLNVQGNAFFNNNLIFNSSTAILKPVDKLFIGGNSIVVAKLLVDPLISSSINGQIYYNTTTNKFRAFENGQWVDLVAIMSSISNMSAIFGDGSDGNVVISTSTILKRDMYYNNLSINNGAILNPNSFRIFVKDNLINNGVIIRIGNNGGDGGGGPFIQGAGSGGFGGEALFLGTLPGGLAGVAGASRGINHLGVSGVSGNSEFNGIGNDGQAGGVGGFGRPSGFISPSPGGSGGLGGAIIQSPARPRDIFTALTLTIPGSITRIGINGGGGGGGSGGGIGDFNIPLGGGGGGSGSNGGVILVSAKNIVNTGSIMVGGGTGGKGGNGGDSPVTNGFGGGGGGGGAGGSGGLILLIFNNLSDTGILNVDGGIGGIGGLGGKGDVSPARDGSSGGKGDNGTSGIIIKLQM